VTRDQEEPVPQLVEEVVCRWHLSEQDRPKNHTYHKEQKGYLKDQAERNV
jgi:hypothetical protein